MLGLGLTPPGGPRGPPLPGGGLLGPRGALNGGPGARRCLPAGPAVPWGPPRGGRTVGGPGPLRTAPHGWTLGVPVPRGPRSLWRAPPMCRRGHVGPGLGPWPVPRPHRWASTPREWPHGAWAPGMGIGLTQVLHWGVLRAPLHSRESGPGACLLTPALPVGTSAGPRRPGRVSAGRGPRRTAPHGGALEDPAPRGREPTWGWSRVRTCGTLVGGPPRPVARRVRPLVYMGTRGPIPLLRGVSHTPLPVPGSRPGACYPFPALPIRVSAGWRRPGRVTAGRGPLRTVPHGGALAIPVPMGLEPHWEPSSSVSALAPVPVPC